MTSDEIKAANESGGFIGPGIGKRAALDAQGWAKCGDMLTKDGRFGCVSYGGLVLWPRLETEAAVERRELEHYRSLWMSANDELERMKSINAQCNSRIIDLELRVLELEAAGHGKH